MYLMIEKDIKYKVFVFEKGMVIIELLVKIFEGFNFM